jgi:hypothetical protein
MNKAMAMQYFQLTGKVEKWDDSSYTHQRTGEVVEKRQLTLVIPGMKDRVLVEFARADAPKDDTLDKWEADESWVVIGADGMRALGFTRSNARAGERAVGALVVFSGVEVRDINGDERKNLQAARRAQKQQAKARRAQRQAEKKAAQAAQVVQATPAQASA